MESNEISPSCSIVRLFSLYFRGSVRFDKGMGAVLLAVVGIFCILMIAVDVGWVGTCGCRFLSL